MTTNSIFVKVAAVPGNVVEVALEAGASVAEAMAAANITAQPGAELTVNGTTTSLDNIDDTTCQNGDVIAISMGAKSA